MAVMPASTVPVLVVGGGPVGLAVAVELGWRGVPCLLIEQGDGTIVDAKMFATGIRTVEFCRRWGFANKVKDWGFPRDFPFDNVFVTTLTGHELGRIRLPTLDETRPPPSSPEQFAHCPQFVFDPLLAEAARRFPTVALRYRCRLASFRDEGDGVVATLHDLAADRQETVRTGYLIACDGFTGMVRQTLGIRMTGRRVINRSANIMFRTPNLAALHDKGNAERYVLTGPEGPWASLVPADGRELWRLMVHGREDWDADSLDPREAVRRAAGRDFPFEIVNVGNWTRRRMVADRYGVGRVVLAGDAVHVMPPNGGLGMNTGIGDAVDLGWKLAAMHQGWGGPHLMDSYETERRPVGVRACDEAVHNLERFSTKADYRHLLDDTPEGEATRAAIGQRLASVNRMAWDNPLNTHLGYRYDASPICVPDGPLPAEPEDSRVYLQTSHPGCRAPHAWLEDGRSTLDLFGRNFTLLRLGGNPPDAASLVAAARHRGMPLDVITLAAPAIADLYERRSVLVRPDGHVAWRGDSVPSDALGLVDRARGALPSDDRPH